jgi:hypothetical protein
MSRKNGRGTMIQKSYRGAVAPIFLVLAFLTGCATNPATVTPTAITTVAPTGCLPANPCWIQQNAVVNVAFTAPFSATVTTSTTPGGTATPVAGVTVTFSAPGAGAGGNFGNGTPTTTATTDAKGIAVSSTFTANGTVGTYNVIASVGTSQLTALFNLANTYVPAAISPSGGTPQSTSLSTQFANTLAVAVKDAGGNSVGAQLPVTFTAPDGMFTDSDKPTTTALTNASGVATSAPYVASSVEGKYTVSASVTVASVTHTTTLDLSNTIVPASITPGAGTTPQTAAISTPFAIPLSVTVMDGSTPPKPVTNAVVAFAAPGFSIPTNPPGPPTAASGTFADTGTVNTNVWTDGSGVAIAPTFTANALAGGYTVTATVVVKSGTTLTAKFALTNQ